MNKSAEYYYSPLRQVDNVVFYIKSKLIRDPEYNKSGYLKTHLNNENTNNNDKLSDLDKLLIKWYRQNIFHKNLINNFEYTTFKLLETLLKEGYSDRAIAEKTGLSRAAVIRFRTTNYLPTLPIKIDEEKINELYKNKLPTNDFESGSIYFGVNNTIGKYIELYDNLDEKDQNLNETDFIYKEIDTDIQENIKHQTKNIDNIIDELYNTPNNEFIYKRLFDQINIWCANLIFNINTADTLIVDQYIYTQACKNIESHLTDILTNDNLSRTLVKNDKSYKIVIEKCKLIISTTLQSTTCFTFTDFEKLPLQISEDLAYFIQRLNEIKKMNEKIDAEHNEVIDQEADLNGLNEKWEELDEDIK